MPTYTRAELYELVWSESRLALGKKLGVSDVWIRKACVRADIPVPPRGYWAKLSVRKAKSRTPLPPRGFGQSQQVTLGPAPRRFWNESDPPDIPPIPVFDEPLELVRERARLALGKVRIPRDFEGAHSTVAKLLAEDETRRAELAQRGYSWNKPRFESVAAIRRLKIVNAVLIALAKAGCRAQIDKEDLAARITCNDSVVRIRLYANKDRENRRWLYLGPQSDVKHEELVLEVESSSESAGVPDRWADTDGQKLERLVPEIAVELLVTAEMSYRASVVRHREWLIEREEERQRELARQKAEAERKERERLAKLEKDRIEYLLRLAELLRKSDDIRTLVASVSSRTSTSPEDARWRSWALAVADRLDPRLLPTEKLFPDTKKDSN